VVAGGKTTKLVKSGDDWQVASDGNFHADRKAVKDLLAIVDTMEVDGVASMNPAKRSTFGVDSTGVGVTIGGSAKSSARFWVGNSTPDFSGLFLRVDGKDDVYSVARINRFQFDRGQQTWRDRKIVPLEAEQIRKMTLSWADTTVTLTREGADSLKRSTWTVAGNRPGESAAPAKPEMARMMATGFGTLLSDAFPTATDTIPSRWEPLNYRFEIEGLNGARSVVEVGPKLSRGQHVVRRAGEPGIYLLGPWRFTRFKKSRAELLAPVPVAADTTNGTPRITPAPPIAGH
jgi:hypothetical protein